MGDELFREGGPHNIKRKRDGKYEMSVGIPKGLDDMTARRCPEASCLPGYFRIKGGMDTAEDEVTTFCPYCRCSRHPSYFHTKDQLKYATDIFEQEAIAAVDRMVRNTLGSGSPGSRKSGGGLFSLNISVEGPAPRPVARPIEEELRRDVKCPHCGLEHSVFGLAFWCPGCDADIFLAHVDQEFAVIRKMLAAVEKRRTELGARVAARDTENALEDTVSIFEAVMKIIAKRLADKQGKKADEIEVMMHELGNAFQNLERSAKEFQRRFQMHPFDLLNANEIAEARATFEKRHPITHNLGVIDRKYLERVRSGELEGCEVRITPQEVERTIEFCGKVLWKLYSEVFEIAPSSPEAWVPGDRPDRVPGLDVSRTAQNLAILFCERSETGTSHDPMMGFGDLQKELVVSKEDLEEAIDDLKDYGLIGFIAAGEHVFSQERLFWHLDPFVKKWQPKEDARKLAEILVNQGEEGTSLTTLEQRTGWPVRRLNPAATFLKEQDIVQVWDGNAHPYAYYGLAPTVKTTRYLKGRP